MTTNKVEARTLNSSSDRSDFPSRLFYQSINAPEEWPILTHNAQEKDPRFSAPPSQRLTNYLQLSFLVTLAACISALVTHSITVSYYNLSNHHSLSLLLKNEHRTMTQNKIHDAQQYASESLRKNLLEPCLTSELYYNGNRSLQAINSTTKINSPPPPPPLPPPENCEATLMILRHCEGGVAREHCGYMGYQRSEYLATLFGNNSKWPEPSYIIAMSAGERHNPVVQNWREIETVQPLADKFHATIDVSYGFPEKEQLTQYLYSLLRSSSLCGKLAVLSWKHHDIPHFSHGMGCGPEQGCPMSYGGEEEYDKVWQIKYSYHRQLHAPYVIEDNSTKARQKHVSWGMHPQWFVYGTVQSETFDPLQFSTTVKGTYKRSITTTTTSTVHNTS